MPLVQDHAKVSCHVLDFFLGLQIHFGCGFILLVVDKFLAVTFLENLVIIIAKILESV